MEPTVADHASATTTTPSHLPNSNVQDFGHRDSNANKRPRSYGPGVLAGTSIDQLPENVLFDDEEEYLGTAQEDEEDLSASASSVVSSAQLSPTIQGRSRAPSVTFKSQVKLDSGDEQPIKGPMPIATNPKHPCRPRGRSILQEIADEASRCRARTHSESDRYKYDPKTGELLRSGKPYHLEEPRQPLLHGSSRSPSEEAEARAEEEDRVPSLASDKSTSPEIEPVQTPKETEQCNGEAINIAPLASSYTSASEIYSTSSPKRPDNPRSLSLFLTRTGSKRRPTRRRSTRSSTPLNSPASAFLSQWGRDDNSSSADPDDEGQEIGEDSQYIIGRQIGYGGFSVVKEAFTIEEDRKVRRAVKIVHKKLSGRDEQENDRLQAEFEHEVSIWRYLKHPYILPLLAVYNTNFATFCITPLSNGGTLFDLVRRHRRKRTQEDGASQHIPLGLVKRYIYQLTSAIRYMHEDVGAVHRDIKLENCLLDKTPPDTFSGENPSSGKTIPDLMLCDFGMADFINRDDRDDNFTRSAKEDSDETDDDNNPIVSTQVAGSLQYASPELIEASKRIFEPSADMWAFGIVCFALITGELPFNHSFLPKLQLMILRGEWNEGLIMGSILARPNEPAIGFNNRKTRQYEAEAARNLVKGCICPDVEARWTIRDVLNCRFLQGCRELYEPDDFF